MSATDSIIDLADSRPGAVTLTLTVSDPEVVAELEQHPAGAERTRYARTALRIGVLCMRQARGEIDASAVKRAGDELIGEIRELLTARANAMSNDMVQTLARYLDPDSGVVQQRLDALVSKNGEIDRLLLAHVGGDQSVLARTLTDHMGQHSPLYKLLSPDDPDGLRTRVTAAVEQMLGEQRTEFVRQFSLDDSGSALSRLIREIDARQAKLGDDVKGKVAVLEKELTLDNPDSALSRMHDMLQTTRGQIDKHLTLDDDGSALARVRRELVGAVEAVKQQNTAFQTEVREVLAAMQARKAEAARGTAHGNDFELQLGEQVAALAAATGDVYEHTGNGTGVIRNCKVGDLVVTMGPDSRAPGARVVFEAKQKDGVKLSEALAESETARKNREAGVGVFVYSARIAPDGVEALARFGDDIVIIWDADDPNTDVLVRAAFSLARGMAMSASAADESTAASLREIDIAVRAIEKQIAHLVELNKLAKTVEGHGSKIVARTDKMQADLLRDIATIDEQVKALERAAEDA